MIYHCLLRHSSAQLEEGRSRFPVSQGSMCFSVLIHEWDLHGIGARFDIRQRCIDE